MTPLFGPGAPLGRGSRVGGIALTRGAHGRLLIPQNAGGPVTLTITIDHTKCGTTDTANFPLVVNVTHSAIKSVANGGSVADAQGNDLVFVDSDGTTILAYDPLISWDAAAGTVVARVRVPTLTHNVDPVIKLLCGAAGVTTFQGGSTGAMWDANYKTVIGGGDGTTLDLADKTSNTNNGTNHGSAVAAAGPGGLGAIGFTAASSQYISTPNTINIGTPTFEAWVWFASNPSSRGSVVGIVQGNGGGTTDKDLSIGTDGTPLWYTFQATQRLAAGPSALSTSAWHYLVGTHDASNEILFVDGVAVATTPVGGTSFAGYSAAGLQINGSYQPTGTPNSTYMTNLVSEVRLSNVVRSADYVLATWNNINSPSTFYTVT